MRLSVVAAVLGAKKFKFVFEIFVFQTPMQPCI
jgi:hypothetical protein